MKASSWAWEQSTESSGQKLVLLALADAAGGNDNDHRMCWPSVGRISRMTGLGDRAVRVHIDRLDEMGLIRKYERRRRQDGTMTTWTYLVMFTTGTPLPVGDDAPGGNHRQSAASGSGIPNHRNSTAAQEPSEEPSYISSSTDATQQGWCDETCELCGGVGWIYPNGEPSGVSEVAPCPNRSEV